MILTFKACLYAVLRHRQAKSLIPGDSLGIGRSDDPGRNRPIRIALQQSGSFRYRSNRPPIAAWTGSLSVETYGDNEFTRASFR